MNPIVIAALVGGIAGILAAAIPAYLASRRAPSRLTTDAVSLVDASGDVIRNLTEEIERLEKGLTAAREESERNRKRIVVLEQVLRNAGIDPLSIT